MQDRELISFEREFGIGLSFVVAELDPMGTVEEFHDRTDLTANQVMLRQIREQSNNVQESRRPTHGVHRADARPRPVGQEASSNSPLTCSAPA